METNMRPMTRSLAVATAISAWQLFLPIANAQVQPPQSQEPQAPRVPSPSPGLTDPSRAIPDEKLDAAAAAIKEVASVQQDYRQRMATANEPDKKGVADEAMNALTKAVTDQGLSVEEYSSILEVAQNDPGVREKILQRIAPSGKSDD